MATTLEPPTATAGPEVHADYLELLSLDPSEDGAAFQELVTQLGIGGSEDALGDDLELALSAEDQVEPIVDGAFNEVDERMRACNGLYPFDSTGAVLTPGANAQESVYLFLALLSTFGLRAGPPSSFPERTFEDICAAAAKAYLGPEADAVPFGFPRRQLPGDFRAALDELARRLGEGKGHRDAPTTGDQRDAKLDIVAWKDFADGRMGKLIVFGQCATGGDWREKISELPDPSKWCQAWLLRSPLVDPVRAFFVPHRIPFRHWVNTNLYGGIFFDRCRIAQFSGDIDSSLLADCRMWSEYVIAHCLLA